MHLDAVHARAQERCGHGGVRLLLALCRLTCLQHEERYPVTQQLIAERGQLETGSIFYHMNAVQSWGIAADGSVKNVHPLG